MIADAEPTSLEHETAAMQVLVVAPVLVLALTLIYWGSRAAAWWRWVEEQWEEWEL